MISVYYLLAVVVVATQVSVGVGSYVPKSVGSSIEESSRLGDVAEASISADKAETRPVTSVDSEVGDSALHQAHPAATQTGPIQSGLDDRFRAQARIPPDPSTSLLKTFQLTVPENIPKNVGNFARVVEPTRLDSGVSQLARWRSTTTGLTVTWAEKEGPIIDSFLTVATPLFEDSGVSQALAHLVLLAAQKSNPIQGLLNTISRRAFGDDPDSYPTTTRTDYTVSTASDEGFLGLLPTYVNQILNPDITQQAFDKEVYHRDENGLETGVVFVKNQGVANDGVRIVNKRAKKLMHGIGSPYSGDCNPVDGLRKLSVAQVKEYHKKYYHPQNLHLTVSGQIDPQQLLEVLNGVDETIGKAGHRSGEKHMMPGGWKRPFFMTATREGDSLKNSEPEWVEFPSEASTSGHAKIGWFGPEYKDFVERRALSIVLRYLTQSEESPLQKSFVRPVDRLCAGVSYETGEGGQTTFSLYFKTVPKDRLAQVPNLIRNFLAGHADHLEFDRIRDAVRLSKWQLQTSLENSPTYYLSHAIRSNFMFAEDSDLSEDLPKRLKLHEELEGWELDQWVAFFKKWLVNQPSATVLGAPSSRMPYDRAAKARKLSKVTGQSGQTDLSQVLETVKKSMSRIIPKEALSDFVRPKLDSVKWINVGYAAGHERLDTPLQTKIDQKDPAQLPFYGLFTHINSNFLHLMVTMSPVGLPEELITLIPIYLDSFFNLPITRHNGVRMSAADVTRKLSSEIVDYKNGFGQVALQSIHVLLTVEKSKYKEGIQWLRDLLWGSEFEVKKLREVTEIIKKNFERRKEVDIGVAAAMYHDMISTPNSILHCSNMFRQETQIPAILQQLDNVNTQPDIINKMKKLRKHLLRHEGMRISVMGNIELLEDPKTAWLNHFELPSRKVIPKALWVDQPPDGLYTSGKLALMEITSIESTMAYHFAQGPKGLKHQDRPALMVAMRALNGVEGILDKAARDTGLVFSVGLSHDCDRGHVILSIDSAPNSWEVFKIAEDVITNLLQMKILDQSLLDTAKDALVYSQGSKLESAPYAAFMGFSDVAMYGVEPPSARYTLEEIRKVQVEDVMNVIKKWILPIFSPTTSNAAVSCSAEARPKIIKAAKEAGYVLEERTWKEKEPATISIRIQASASSSHP